MKITFCIILLTITCNAQAQGVCNRDTIYYQDGKINRITDFDTLNNRYCGIYIAFDSLGSKIKEGHFKGVDSVICSHCYTEKYGDSTSKWQQYQIAKYVNEIPVGKWEYYHPNGKLKEVGIYCNSVHEYTGMTYPFKWGDNWPEPVNGY